MTFCRVLISADCARGLRAEVCAVETVRSGGLPLIPAATIVGREGRPPTEWISVLRKESPCRAAWLVREQFSSVPATRISGYETNVADKCCQDSASLDAALSWRTSLPGGATLTPSLCKILETRPCVRTVGSRFPAPWRSPGWIIPLRVPGRNTQWHHGRCSSASVGPAPRRWLARASPAVSFPSPIAVPLAFPPAARPESNASTSHSVCATVSARVEQSLACGRDEWCDSCCRVVGPGHDGGAGERACGDLAPVPIEDVSWRGLRG